MVLSLIRSINPFLLNTEKSDSIRRREGRRLLRLVYRFRSTKFKNFGTIFLNFVACADAHDAFSITFEIGKGSGDRSPLCIEMTVVLRDYLVGLGRPGLLKIYFYKSSCSEVSAQARGRGNMQEDPQVRVASRQPPIPVVRPVCLKVSGLQLGSVRQGLPFKTKSSGPPLAAKKSWSRS